MQNKIIAIVPAAGVGARAQASPAVPPASAVPLQSPTFAQLVALPKQYRLLKGQPMLRWAVQALLADSRIEQVRVAVAAHDTWVQEALQGLERTVWRPCGGLSRAATVAAALHDAQLDDQDWVLVHDAARPGLPIEALRRLIDTCVAHSRGGLLAIPVPDTVKRARQIEARDDEEACLLTGGPGIKTDALFAVDDTVPRDSLWLAQTPQMFRAGVLSKALAQVKDPFLFTDESSAVEQTGVRPLLVQGAARNFKVTWPEDFELMERWL